MCVAIFWEAHHIEFLPLISEDEPFDFALFCLTERYYILHEALYIYRKRSGSIMKSLQLDRLSKGIQVLALGSVYINSRFHSEIRE